MRSVIMILLLTIATILILNDLDKRDLKFSVEVLKMQNLLLKEKVIDLENDIDNKQKYINFLIKPLTPTEFKEFKKDISKHD